MSSNTDDLLTEAFQYHSLSKIRPWVMKLSGCSKRGVDIFLRTLSLKNRPTPLESRPTIVESRPTQVLKNPDITDLSFNNKQNSSKTVQQE